MQLTLPKFAWLQKPTRVQWVFIFLGYFIIHLPAILRVKPEQGFDFYGDLASSLLHGNLNLQNAKHFAGDLILFQGKYYLPYPPFPAFLLTPFVWIFGPYGVNTVFISVLCSCLNIYLLHGILKRLQVAPENIALFLLAFFFGSGYWFALFSSYFVYPFAHIIALTLCLGIVYEFFGRRRWWLIGVLTGCSFLTRQFTIFYALLALISIWQTANPATEPRRFFRDLFSFSLPLGAAIVLYCAYNFFRFGNIMETGYRYIVYIGVLNERVKEYGVFNLRYIPINAYSLIFKGFNINFTGNTLMKIRDVDLWGTSLFSSAPYIITAFRAKLNRNTKIAIWCTIISMLPGILSYHNNGFEQVNTFRFALDFFPLLFVLVAAGADAIPRWLLKSLIFYAVALNLLAFAVHFLAKAH